MAALLDQSVASAAQTDAQLAALPEPAGDVTTIQSLFAKDRVFDNDLTQWASALRRGDRAQSQALAAQAQTDSKADNDAYQAYGLSDCGQS